MEIFLGVLVSVLLQGLKKWAKLGEYETLLAVVCLSLLGGAFHFFLSQTSFWQSIVGVLTSAGATYAFIIRRFDKAESQ